MANLPSYAVRRANRVEDAGVAVLSSCDRRRTIISLLLPPPWSSNPSMLASEHPTPCSGFISPQNKLTSIQACWMNKTSVVSVQSSGVLPFSRPQDPSVKASKPARLARSPVPRGSPRKTQDPSLRLMPSSLQSRPQAPAMPLKAQDPTTSDTVRALFPFLSFTPFSHVS